VVGKRFGVAEKTGSSPGDRFTVARFRRGSTTVMAWSGFRGGGFRVRGAPGQHWDPRGGVGKAEGGPEVAVHGEVPVEEGGR
jgi:hypothetical protein